VCAQANGELIVLSTDGYKKRYCENSTPNMCCVLLLPSGGAIFLKMDPVPKMAKSAEAFCEYHKALIDETTGGDSQRFGGLIVDNVAGNISGMRGLALHFPTGLFVGCWSHVLNLLPKQFTKLPKDGTRSPRTTGIAEVLNVVLKLSLCLGDCATIRGALREKQVEVYGKTKAISPHIPTRWGNLDNMVKDVIECKTALLLLVTENEDEWSNLAEYSDNSKYIKKAVEGSFMKKLEATSELLSPITDGIRQLEADQALLSQVLPTMMAIIDHASAWEEFYSDADNPNKLPASMTKNVFKSAEYRFHQHYIPCVSAAYIVDPVNYKSDASGVHSPVGELPESMRDDAVFEIARLAEVSLSVADEEVTRLELGSRTWPPPMARLAAALSNSERIPCTSRPAGFRIKVADVAMRRTFVGKMADWGFPSVAKAGVRLLSMHATSAAAERANSAYGSTYTSDRANLKRETADMIVRVRSTESQRRAVLDSKLFAERVTLRTRLLKDKSKGYLLRRKAAEMPAPTPAAGAAAAAPKQRGRPAAAAVAAAGS
jgi:hypothetical protein